MTLHDAAVLRKIDALKPPGMLFDSLNECSREKLVLTPGGGRVKYIWLSSFTIFDLPWHFRLPLRWDRKDACENG